mmetsp:Transcript_820/g.1827  ORF Transcript_820/g.1827 Transcript_820/m.1827 type:complete len:207 (-) Transcript_820:981-1601(-)
MVVGPAQHELGGTHVDQVQRFFAFLQQHPRTSVSDTLGQALRHSGSPLFQGAEHCLTHGNQRLVLEHKLVQCSPVRVPVHHAGHRLLVLRHLHCEGARLGLGGGLKALVLDEFRLDLLLLEFELVVSTTELARLESEVHLAVLVLDPELVCLCVGVQEGTLGVLHLLVQSSSVLVEGRSCLSLLGTQSEVGHTLEMRYWETVLVVL